MTNAYNFIFWADFNRFSLVLGALKNISAELLFGFLQIENLYVLFTLRAHFSLTEDKEKFGILGSSHVIE